MTISALPQRPHVRLRRRTASVVACVATAAAAMLVGAPSARAVTGFTAGDLVIYRVGAGSTGLTSSSAPVFLDEYTPGGAQVQSIPLLTSASGSNKPLVASGSSSSEGLITLSPNGNDLVATGYDAGVGVSKISGTAAATTPRTVAVVTAGGSVDTSTALTDFADGNNPRSATTDNGTNLWVGGASGGLRYTTIGSSTSTAVTSSTYKNVRQVGLAGGQLYTSADPSKANITVATVGTGQPTSGSLTPANLNFSTPPVDPYAYSFLTLGNGTAPDTLYVADPTQGAVLKYGLVGSTWTAEGSVAVPGVTGLTANDSGGTVSIFATSSGSAGIGGTLYGITDSSGVGGTLSGTPTQLATAPANEAFRGVAFTPGTTIGSGGGIITPPVVPTITPTASSLPAAINDPTNPTLGVTVGDAAVPADQLTVAASSSNPAVAPQSGISVTGSGASRTVSLTPGGTVGYSTITLTVTAPDGSHASTNITYGVSADLGDPSDRYFSGAGNASAAIDVGGGYMVVGDDESDSIRLYDETQSGPPVKTFDFSSLLPFGNAEVDTEAAARSGNTIYWLGSLSNNSSGQIAPARSTLFATQITGSGANTTLTYVGSYTGLQSDLVNWDHDNLSGLGVDHFGFYQSVHGGIGSHEDDALNVEGMEFAGSSSSTAYLAFRAPLEPTSDRHLALVIPVTNIDQLVDGNPGTTTATFGNPMMWDLGGLGVRDIRENADGSYLVIAGTADGTNSSFVLYSWDGDPADAPEPTGTSLPLVPSGANQGSWETIVSVPEPLASGDPVQLLEDNGDTAWYGDGATSKDTLPSALQKDLGRVFSYVPPAPHSVTITASDEAIGFGSADPTFGFTTTGLTGSDELVTDPTCGVDGDHTAVGTYPITCSGAVTSHGDGDTIQYVDGTLTVTPDPTSIAVSADTNPATTGQPVTLTAIVSGPFGVTTAPTGTIEFAADGADLPGCSSVSLSTGAAQCTVAAGFPAGSHSIVATYSGDSSFDGSDTSASPFVETIDAAATTVGLTSSVTPPAPGAAETYTAVVAPVAPGAGSPTGTVTFSVTGPGMTPDACNGGNDVAIVAGAAGCTIPAADVSAGATYSVSAVYDGDSNFNSSTGTLTQTAALSSAMVAVTSSVNPAGSGQALTFGATVTAVAPATGTPTGSVTFSLIPTTGPTINCTSGDTKALSSSGVATCGVAKGSVLAADGPYVVTATYSGDTTFDAMSGSLTQLVTKAETKTVLTRAVARTSAGVKTTFTATITPATGVAAALTGSVTFTVTGRNVGQVSCDAGNVAPVVNGAASCRVTPGGLTSNGHPYQVVAAYSGDANNSSSTVTYKPSGY